MTDLIGRIGLVSGGTDFWSRVIHRVTRSPFEHAVLAVNETMCASAEPDGVVIRPIDTLPRISWMPPLGAPDEMRRVAFFAEGMAGTAYNHVAFVLAGLASRSVPIPAAVSNWARQFGVTCSMLADWAHDAAGIDLIGDPVTAWPGRLALNVRKTVQERASV